MSSTVSPRENGTKTCVSDVAQDLSSQQTSYVFSRNTLPSGSVLRLAHVKWRIVLSSNVRDLQTLHLPGASDSGSRGCNEGGRMSSSAPKQNSWRRSRRMPHTRLALLSVAGDFLNGAHRGGAVTLLCHHVPRPRLTERHVSGESFVVSQFWLL